MAVLEMEIVVRAVKVGRHHGNIIGPVLDIETLAHLQPCNLGDGIRFVCIFERGCEQAVLGHRLRRLAWIDACAPEKKQFLHPVPETLPDDILLYLEILPYEVGPVLQVGHYASDMRCCKHHSIRLLPVEKLPDSHPVKQVKFPVAAPRKVGIPPLQEVVPDGRPHQPVVSGNIYLRIFVEHDVFAVTGLLSEKYAVIQDFGP